MKKTFMGVRLRKLRAEQGLTQVAMAQAIGLSPSYLNQLEQNQRPLTVAVLLKINRAFGIDIQQFSEDEELRLIATLRDALATTPEPVDATELHEVATQMPSIVRALLALHQRNTRLEDQLEMISERLDTGLSDFGNAPEMASAMPYEMVREFFFENQNYFDSLDRTAESLAAEANVSGTALVEWLSKRLLDQHGIRVLFSQGIARQAKRRYDPNTRTLRLGGDLITSQQVFQLATQLGLVEQQATISRLVVHSSLRNDPASLQLARIGLANYFAGAVLLPYQTFLQAAEELHYDLDLLSLRFGVGFETVCHRLSTMQRPSNPGVPFFFVRVDRAGNISKRQSATHFHFRKSGGTCPLWNVYEAFSQPGHLLVQRASMPDGQSYLWMARTVSHSPQGWGAPVQTFSIGLGCEMRHAHRLVYSRGLNLQDTMTSIPIGMGCKVCERPACSQRAFPFIGKALMVDENESSRTPYGFGD
ncbi:short-chain fatty acyl-CoA regulator family protein [Lampropedia aestuarii]|uniref:short-chain fatty acyl-CoA regulator family protein n=1 Tax=Lampropedia aestuarii TaxID=2562762 RepID=UPI0024696E1F|nr:short-chain fatty acyl-CoA regulator family protein [Lampropedia aestuarii]MDH5855693.1 short-chain fatty acyl-CoA regulator family protein [Lampropedia aestuarii]